jgi:phosphoglycerate dehydrogenase-like enzyme
MSKKLRLLVNLPPSFFTVPELKPHFARLSRFGAIRKRSHNTPEEIAADLAWAQAIIMWSWPVFDDKQLATAPDLRYLGQINTTGTTARASLKKGIALSEARHCWSPAVAEMALTLTLTGLRKVSQYHAAMREAKEKWVGAFPAEVDPLERELTGRSVGVVGFGGIGRRLAALLAPFSTDLRIYDPFVPAAAIAQAGGKRVGLAELIRHSDVVVLCAANTEGARHLLGRREIAALRKDCVLVNVGRSMLVDMKALEKRLRRRDMVAMLDVFDKEPLEKNAALRKLPNVFLTPHRAGGVMSSVQRALTMLTDDLEAQIRRTGRKYAVTEKMLPCFPD